MRESTEPESMNAYSRITNRALAVVTVLTVLATHCPQPYAQTAPVAPPLMAPRIGLALSGGGARGIAHVGVLKVLDELRVPISCVTGTSMGAIVGATFAAGRTPAEMEMLVLEANWEEIFRDKPPRGEIAVRRKIDDYKTLFAPEYGVQDGGLALPKGVLAGIAIESAFRSMVTPAFGITDFRQLPISFNAIATDIETGKEVVLGSGSLAQAMRASMSVPGMFAPVEIDGRILGDGGLVNNLPVDLVRKMGADIVIAVNIGTPLMSRDQLQSVVGYASQMLNILTEQNVRAQLATLKPTDILISPDLGNLTFIDFAAAPKFVEIGEKAAEAVRTQLAALSDSPERYAAFERKLKVLPEKLPERLDFVTVEGSRYTNPEVLEDQMRTKPDEPFKLSTLESDLARLYGRGEFEQIDYQLTTVGNQNGVIVTVTEKSWGPNFLRFGTSLSTDFQGETFFNLMLGHRRSGQIIMLLVGLFAAGMPVIHMRGAHYPEIAKSAGGFFFVWTLWALGGLGGLTFVLSARELATGTKP